MPQKYVDLNSDLGESFGAYSMGMDSLVLKYITSANIACGWHAGDPLIMLQAVATSVKEGVSMGAHPGFSDLMGFGRRELIITPEEAKAYVMYQVGALEVFTRAAGAALRHVKAHGAMYNMAAKDEKLARAIAEGVKTVNPDLILMGLSNSQLTKAGESAGLQVAHEVFADRAYKKDGSLVPRNQPGAMIEDTDQAIARVIRMVKEGMVEAITGETIFIQADSICVHGDSPQALEFVKKIRKALEKENLTIAPL